MGKMKAVIGEKFMALRTQIKMFEKSKINNWMRPLKNLENVRIIKNSKR